MFLLSFDFFCDLLLYGPTESWNLFVLCEKNGKMLLMVMSWMRRPLRDLKLEAIKMRV